MSRNTMKFLVPMSITSLGTFDTTERAVIPFYINPANVKFAQQKIINKQQTKGGFLIQYWGEELETLQVSGMTGSGGIEAIQILRDVYRHEQLIFTSILLDREKDFANNASLALNSASEETEGGFTAVADALTGGAFSQIVDGISSTIEVVSNAITGKTDATATKEMLMPSPAAFAVSIDLYYQGEKYRGYFSNLNYDENEGEPGLHNYDFEFVITKKTGKRKNYMPWHRNPYDASGVPRVASLPVEGQKLDELTFPFENGGEIGTTSQFIANSEINAEINDVGVSRFAGIRK